MRRPARADRCVQAEPLGATTGAGLFERAAATWPDAPAVHYFDDSLSFGELRELAHALAAGLRGLGVEPGDRVALLLQNVPQFVYALHACWLLGAVVTPLSPLLRSRELAHQLADSGARVVICLDSLHAELVAALPGTAVEHVIATSALEHTSQRAGPLAGSAPVACPGASDLAGLVARHGGARSEPHPTAPGNPALLTYTSGTTGPPKGAINTHANLCAAAGIYHAWADLGPGDTVLGLAPLFHITGLTAHVGCAAAAGSPLVLLYRFDAGEVLRLVERHRATFTVGPLTAFIALLDHPDSATRDLSSLAKAMSGGAPVLPAVADRFERATGHLLHNVYGLTESTGPSHLTPIGARGPVDAESGALAVGVTAPGVECRIVDLETGAEVATGEIGELLLRGATVVPGYWNQPEETAHALRDGWLHTGDVGKRDDAGWFYLVDRAKDMIVASGYKVWPREVEDALCEHPAVAEASVVGVPDSYRGETVKAFVRLRPGAAATAEELIAHCRRLKASYKAPRLVELVEALPTTASGKVLRRELRERHAAGGPPTTGGAPPT